MKAVTRASLPVQQDSIERVSDSPALSSLQRKARSAAVMSSSGPTAAASTTMRPRAPWTYASTSKSVKRTSPREASEKTRFGTICSCLFDGFRV